MGGEKDWFLETQSEQSPVEKCDICTFLCFHTAKSLKTQLQITEMLRDIGHVSVSGFKLSEVCVFKELIENLNSVQN